MLTSTACEESCSERKDVLALRLQGPNMQVSAPPLRAATTPRMYPAVLPTIQVQRGTMRISSIGTRVSVQAVGARSKYVKYLLTYSVLAGATWNPLVPPRRVPCDLLPRFLSR